MWTKPSRGREEDLVGMRFPFGTALRLGVVTRQAVVIDDLQPDPRFARQAAERAGYVRKALLAIPLLHGDRALGVLQVLDRGAEGSFSSERGPLDAGREPSSISSICGAPRRAQAVLGGVTAGPPPRRSQPCWTRRTIQPPRSSSTGSSASSRAPNHVSGASRAEPRRRTFRDDRTAAVAFPNAAVTASGDCGCPATVGLSAPVCALPGGGHLQELFLRELSSPRHRARTVH